MPIPKSRNVGKIISFLKKEKPSMEHKQRIAIALSQARKAGADIPELSEAIERRRKKK